MIFFKDLFADLMEKRLWPLALALIVALVAIPVVLSEPARESATAGTGGAPAESGSILSETQPVVSLADRGEGGFRHDVSRFPRNDPFAPQVRASPSSGTGSSSGTATPVTGGGSSSSALPSSPETTGSTGSTGSVPSKTVFSAYVASVRFGKLGKTKKKTVQRLRALPTSDNPAITFLGATTDGETAVFLVSSEARPRGDGACKPDEDTCTFVHMKAGDDEFFDVTSSSGAVTTYVLKLLKIVAKEVETPTSSASALSGYSSQVVDLIGF